MQNNNVNLFFACDNGYIPFLAVTLLSIKEHASKNRVYDVKILNTGICEEYKNKITDSLADEKFIISFPDISDSVKKINKELHTRDYYSKATYFRLFIPKLYKKMTRALYLDCDIVLLDDVAKLYDTNLGDNLVGAVADGFVASVDRLHDYVTERVGVKSWQSYFNAGVLLMNLSAMRNFNFEEKFTALLSEVKFDVAQDQDYLNAICGNRRTVIGSEWNCMPGFSSDSGKAKLIHYNLDSKPWHKDNVEFSDCFWNYADRCCFADEIRKIKEGYADNAKSESETLNLIDIAEKEASETKENEKIKQKILSILG